MIKMKYKFFNAAAGLFSAVCVICISVSAVLLMRFIYYFDINNLDIPEISGYSAQICRINYDTLIDYNLIGGEDKLVFPSFSMSDTGEIHFREVKDIFIKMQIAAVSGIITFAAWIIYVSKKGVRKSNTLWMRITGVLLIFTASATAVLMMADWEAAFQTMHEIFFDNDYWIFDPAEDPVIKILPDEFFFHCGVVIAAVIVLLSAGLEMAYRRINRR